MGKLRRTFVSCFGDWGDCGGAGAGSAWGAPPLEGTTTSTITSDDFLDVRVADGNLFTEELLTAELVGTFTGTSSFTIHGVVHADGSAEYQGTGTFTGTIVGCRSVTLDFQTRFRASASGDVAGTSGSIGNSPVRYHNSYVGSILSPSFTETSTYRC